MELAAPRVGVAILITRGERVLLLRRRGVHGAGTWSTPGGHLEPGEAPEVCAQREAEEETGVRVKNVTFRCITNDIFAESGKHYITLWMQGDYDSGEARINAPYEVAEVGWFAWDALPEPLFLSLANLLAGRCYPPPEPA
ncbi:MAG: NUDIX domain-containing protein [Chloroflexi bacterium]|jgi:8-oxo-dGTP diphosphatase|nr:NUDIX domain-containing protein [Chloroflexota bacterium]